MLHAIYIYPAKTQCERNTSGIDDMDNRSASISLQHF